MGAGARVQTRPDPIRSSASGVCFLVSRRFGIAFHECCADEAGDLLSVPGVALWAITPLVLLCLLLLL